jgi:parvulin-like peptidyl-prolyl isomerase
MRSFIIQNAQAVGQNRLFSFAAKREGIHIQEGVIDLKLENIYKQRGGRERYESYLKSKGFTLDYMKDEIASQILHQKFLDPLIDPHYIPTDEELKQLYQQDKTATVRYILFLTEGKSEKEKSEIKSKGQDILKRARLGENFSELASEFSDDHDSKDKGGLYENFGRGQMAPSFEDAAFKLPIGAISDLVETRYGYYLIKIIDRQKETRPFEEVKEELKSAIIKKLRAEAYRKVIDDLKVELHYTEHFDRIK